MFNHKLYFILFYFLLFFFSCNTDSGQKYDVETYYKEISLFKIILADLQESIDIRKRYRSKATKLDSLLGIGNKDDYDNELEESYSLLKQKLDSLILNRPTFKLISYKPDPNQFTWIQNWDKIEKGTSYKKVLQILGVPMSVSLLYDFRGGDFPNYGVEKKPLYFDTFFYESDDISGDITFDDKWNVVNIHKPSSQ